MILFLRWLGRFVEEGSTGNPSIKRISLIMAISSLSTAAIVLAASNFMHGTPVGAELAAVCTALAGLAGGGYILGKKVENDAGGPPA